MTTILTLDPSRPPGDGESLIYNDLEKKWLPGTREVGERGVTRTIYVRATGSDTTGDGSTTSMAYREVSRAVADVAVNGPVLHGSVIIDVGAGTYKGGITVPSARGRAQDDYIKILGPAMDHPSVPTAIIDLSADPAAQWGILAADGTSLWIEDLKFIGGFANAVRIERGVLAQIRNIHVDGVNAAGSNGLSVQSRCMYFVLGGLIENCLVSGVSDLFNNVRSFSFATSNAEAMTISNCGTGFETKEGSVGHLDYLNVQDCDTGIELNGMCVANIKGVSLKRNTLGLAVVNSEVHNGSSVIWGTGGDANTREYIAVGSAAADLTDLGWTDGAYARTADTGHRPLVTIAADYADVMVTGVAVETTLKQLDNAVTPHRYNTVGKRLRVEFWGSVNATVTTATGYRLLLRIGGNLAGEVRIPQTAVVGDDFHGVFTIVCSADGNNQKVMGTLSGYPNYTGAYSTRTLDLTTPAAQSVRLSAIPAATSESVTLHMIEVWG